MGNGRAVVECALLSAIASPAVAIAPSGRRGRLSPEYETLRPYVVMMDPVGSNGLPTGQPIIRPVGSEAEGLRIIEGAAIDAEKARQQMVFSLYDHEKRLVVSYVNRDGALAALGAFAP